MSVVGVTLGAGDQNCPVGGVKYSIGDTATYVCNGFPGDRGPQGDPGASVTVTALPPGDANCASGGSRIDSATGATYVCNGARGTAGTNGVSVTATALSSGDSNCPAGGTRFDSASGSTYACNGAAAPSGANQPGGSSATAAASCSALLTAGMTQSGQYWVKNPAPLGGVAANTALLVYCDQTTNGGGWALLENSVLGPNTLDFFSIPYAQRFARRGTPALASNFYDGSLYQSGAATYLDVVEDLHGKAVVALVASATAMDAATMRFTSPTRLAGNADIFTNQFASGWSAPDYAGDGSGGNCATLYNNSTQHYGSCWAYNFGSDADASGGDSTDGRLGPHLANADATSLGLYADGSAYTRLRRVTRFVKW